jgi:hypothetical protein
MTEKEKKMYLAKNSTAMKMGNIIGNVVAYGILITVILFIAVGIKFGIVYLLK